MLFDLQYGRVLRELREVLASAGLLTPVTYPPGQNSHIINSQNGETCNVTAKLIMKTSRYVM